MKKTIYKKLGISIIASTLLASQLSTVSALSVISSTGEEYEVSETLQDSPGTNRLVRNLVHFIIDDGTN
ncbi:conserved hypothetical protein, partial [Streptococcus pneumoniae]